MDKHRHHQKMCNKHNCNFLFFFLLSFFFLFSFQKGYGQLDDCSILNFTGSDGKITVSGLAPQSTIEIIGINTDWLIVPICNGDCSETQIIPDLEAGEYIVKVQLFGADGTYCYREEKVNVMDGGGNGAITLVCRGDTTIASPIGTSAVVNFDNPIGSTTCPLGGLVIEQTSDNPSGSELFMGVNLITFTARDACGNEATCSFRIIIGNRQPVNLSGIVFNDLNKNGFKEDNEPNLPNVAIRNGSALVGTGRGGQFNFRSYPGDHHLIIESPIGFKPTIQTGQVTDDIINDSDIDPLTGRTETFLLSSNEVIETISAGFVELDNTTANCATLTFTTRSGISITGLTPQSKVEYLGQNTNYQTITHCDGNCGTNRELIPGLETGEYTVKVQLFGADGTYCYREEKVNVVNGNGTTGGIVNCNDLTFIEDNEQIIVEGLRATYDKVEIIGSNTNYQIVTICDGDCNDTQVIPNLIAGDYMVKVNQRGNNGSFCYREENVTVMDSLGNGMMTLVCPRNQSITPPISTAPIVFDDDPMATTTCPLGGLKIEQIEGFSSGNNAGIGFYPMTFRATDACGNEETCSFQLIVGGTQPVSLKGIVFNDLNANGFKEANEPGIRNVSIKTNHSFDHNTYDRGEFEILSFPGDCQVTIETPIGFKPTIQTGQVTDAIAYDSDIDPLTGRTETFFMSSGERIETISAGFIALDNTTANCEALIFTTRSRNIINIAGLTPQSKVEYLGQNTGYQVITRCDGNCATNGEGIFFSEPGEYTVKVQLFGADGTYCYQEETVTIPSASSSRANNEIYLATYQKSQNVQLQWAVSSIEETSYFLIERSFDGDTFEPLTLLTNIAEDNTFQWTDEHPKTGANHYRVKQIFDDNTTLYSTVQSEEFFLKAAEITLFPNPTRDLLNVHSPSLKGKTGTIQIYSIFGQQVAQYNNINFEENLQTIAVNDLENGLYWLTLKVENAPIINKRFVVERLK